MFKSLIEQNKFPLVLALLIQITELLFHLSGHVEIMGTGAKGSFLLWVMENGKFLHIVYITLIAIFAFCILARKNLFLFSSISIVTVLLVSWLFNSWVLIFLYPILIRHKKVSKINISQHIKSEQDIFEEGFSTIIFTGMLAFSILLMLFQFDVFIFDWRYSLFAFGVNNIFSIFNIAIFIFFFLFIFSISVFFKGSANLTAKVSAMGLMLLVFSVIHSFLSAHILSEPLASVLNDYIYLVAGIWSGLLFIIWGEIKYDHSFSELLYSILSPIVQRGYWGKLFVIAIILRITMWKLGSTTGSLCELINYGFEISTYFIVGWLALGGAFTTIKPFINAIYLKKIVMICFVMSAVPFFLFYGYVWNSSSTQEHYNQNFAIQSTISAIKHLL